MVDIHKLRQKILAEPEGGPRSLEPTSVQEY